MDEGQASESSWHPALRGTGLFGRLVLRLAQSEAGGRHVIRAAFVAAGLAWLPLLALSGVSGALWGDARALPFLSDPLPHVRFLVAVPLLVLATIPANLARSFLLRYLESSGLLPEPAGSRYDAALASLSRWRTHRYVELLLLALAIAITWTLAWRGGGGNLAGPFPEWAVLAEGSARSVTPAGWWQRLVSLPIFLFLILGWTWRHAVWSLFLLRVSRLIARPRAIHPDRMGGLGPLASGQTGFVWALMAVGAVLAAQIGQDAVASGVSVEFPGPLAAAFVLLSLLVIFGPLLLFVPRLAKARRVGVIETGLLGVRLADAFQARWRDAGGDVGPKLLDAPDASALADFATDVQIAQEMRVVPVDMKTLLRSAVLLLLPFLPLYLAHNTVRELLARLGGILR